MPIGSRRSEPRPEISRYGVGGWLTVSAMPDDDLASKIASYRETAATLREIAEQLRGDPRRANQLRSLADAFERYAMKLERELETADAMS